jgi:hypothetical protein
MTLRADRWRADRPLLSLPAATTGPSDKVRNVDAFSYLSVLISIVIGLAITQVLQGYRSLLVSRRRVRFFGPTLAWGGLLLIIAVQSWWAMFGMRLHERWTFLQFAIVLLQAILLYLLAALVFPDVGNEHEVDLKDHYFGQVRWFFGFGMALLIVSVGKDLILTGLWPGPTNLAFHAVFFSTWTIAGFTKHQGYHRLLPWLMAAGFGLYVLVLFSRL